MLVRDWRAGELRVLAMALVVAVAAITSVAFFADRVGQGLARDAHQLLGADLVLVADQPWQTRGRGRDRSRRPAARRGDQLHQHGLGEGRPPRGRQGGLGQLPAARAPAHRQGARPARRAGRARPGARHRVARGAPGHRARGAGRLAHQARPFPVRGGRGDHARARAQHQLLQHRAAAHDEHRRRAGDRADPDRQPGLVLPLCRRTRRENRIISESRSSSSAASASIRSRPDVPRSARRWTVRSVSSASPRCSRRSSPASPSRSARAASSSATWTAARSCAAWARRSRSSCGSTRVEFVALGLAACAAGCVIGFAAQEAIAATVAEVIRADLPPPRVLPAVQGFLVGLVLLLGFALPPLVQLKNVPAVRVMRRESGAPKGGTVAAYAAGLISLSALLVWQAGDLRLGLTVVGGFAAAVAVFFVVAWAFPEVADREARDRPDANFDACATASPTSGAMRAATRCRSRASPSGLRRCCCSPSRAMTSSTPGGAARRRMRPTVS